MSCGVYKITNKLTGECYIGSSKNIEKRFKQHKQPGYWKKQPNNPLYKAFQEYGLADFNFDILEESSDDNLKGLEDKYIRELIPAYNHNRAYNPEHILSDKQKQRHLETSLRYAENHKDDPAEKERRNKNSNAWKERNREKAREAVRRWKARKKLEAEQNK